MSMHRFLVFLLPLFASALRLSAVSLDPALTETTFIQNAGLAFPTGLGWAPDGSNRLFVIRKGGEVRVVQNGALVSTPWATITPIYTSSECGLIGFCFDPDFLNNRYVYCFVTVSASEQQIIRYTDNPGTNLGNGKTILVPGLPTAGANHDGGGVGIGPDGKLYWAIGDNGNGTGVDGNLTSLAAKVGRADRFTGAACNDNPFFDGAGTNNDYIWARGLRNPFTFTFEPRTGRLWVDSVGTGWEQVFVMSRGDHAGYNDYENNQPAGFLPPVIAYQTNGILTTNIAAAGAVRSGGIATFTTTASHRLRQGGKVTIAGVTATSFNGAFYVGSVVSNTQIRVTQAGPDETSGSGTAATQRLGGAIGGGTFYDSTAFPAAYRRNFFFTDYNTISETSDGGRVMRATLDANNRVSSVEVIANFLGQALDAATGPDGALYVVRHTSNGHVHRYAHTAAAQNVIVQPTAFNVVEGGSALFTVRLAQAPVFNVVVEVERTSGDADLTVSAGGVRTFTPANWNVAQTVTISAAEDAGLENDAAIFRVSAPGLAAYDVEINGIDNDEPNLVMSAANVALNEGSTATFTVRLANAPATNVTVSTARTAGDTDVSISGGASLLFTTVNYATPQTVTVAAAEDADTAAETATLTVSAPGEISRTVAATVTDNDFVAPAFDSPPDTTAVINAAYSYAAHATGNPAPTYSLPTSPTGMSIDTATGLVTWTPNSTGTFPVTIQAGNGILPNATQSFTITASADAPPVASLTAPAPGGLVSGTGAEFYGDGIDDVSTVKAEFFIDGLLRYTDVQNDNHFHFGGTHVQWDTTQLTNGPHTLLFRVTDTAGQTGQVQMQVTVGNGYSAWKTQHFTPAEQADPAISGDLANPDRDLFANLLEYSWDSAPKSPDTDRAPKIGTVQIAGSDYLTLEIVQVKWATDLTYRVQSTDTLGGVWTDIDPADPTYRLSVQDNVPTFGLQTVIVRDVLPMGATPRFLRLKVVK
jgi:glucose/arabinose dehydrogenase